MRKKLDTRFPASRIKKIMQADEDVGKIANAVPVLVSKALELFLQDLCDRTYSITLQRGMKTMSSLHLKQCIQSYNAFDFLRDIVRKVPDIGGCDGSDDRSAKRRKLEGNESDEDAKRTKNQESGYVNSTYLGRGRGGSRGRGRRGSRQAKFEDESSDFSSPYDRQPLGSNYHAAEDGFHADERTRFGASSGSTVAPSLRNFDLNLDLDENGDASPPSVPAPPTAIKTQQREEYPGWSLPDIDKIASDPLGFSRLSRGLVEDDEDYDEEG